MQDTKDILEKHIQVAMEDLHNMRGRIRLKIHLGKMDLQSTWKEIDSKIDELSNRFSTAAEEKLEELEDAAKKLTMRTQELESKLERCARAG